MTATEPPAWVSDYDTLVAEFDAGEVTDHDVKLVFDWFAEKYALHFGERDQPTKFDHLVGVYTTAVELELAV